MTEAIDSTPYINAFLTERPKDGMDQIQSRLRSALKLNDEIADYFKERALVEDTYAKSLAKLNKKTFITDKQALGNLRPAWEKLQNELFDASTIHATLAAKILDDIEKFLRSAIVTNQAYADIRSMDPMLQKLVKEYDERQGKMAKQKKVLEKNGKKPLDADIKYTESKKQLDAVQLDWQQNSIGYIQKFQTVDVHRWIDIKNCLMQFESVQADQMWKRVQLAKDNLESVSEFSVENETLSFCGQYRGNCNPSSSLPSSMVPHGTTVSSELPHPTNGTEQTVTTAPPSLLIDVSDDPVHPQSTLSTDSFSSTHTKQTAISSLPSSADDKPDMITQRRGSKAPSIASSKKSDKQRKFLSTLSIRLKPKSSNNRINQHHLELPDSTTAEKAPGFMDNASGYSVYEEAASEENKQVDQQSSVSSNTLQTPPTLRKITSFSDSFFNQPSPSQSQGQQDDSPPNILIDAEGFSIPPPDRSPWATDTELPSSSTGDNQQEINDITSMDNASLHGSLPPRFKLDIKTDSVVQEDATSSQVALTRVASMLKESNPTTTAKRSRGRRDLRSQIFLQGNTLLPGQPTTPPFSSTIPLEEGHLIPSTTTLPISDDPIPMSDGDDGQQLHTSGVEQQGLVVVAPTNVDMTQPTLSVSITEVIHAQLRQGEAQRVMVIGQVALLYEGPAEMSTTPLQFLIKHNATEMTSLADCIQIVEETDQGVIYQWTPAPSSGMESPEYMTCLHYRQCQDESISSGLVVPLLVKPMWKCDGDQARLIIKYSKTADSKALNQLMMVTHVGGDCHGAQSMPTGQWMVDQQRMMWSLVGSQDEQVIRAKFATTSQAAPQPIAVRFEIQHQLVSSLQVVEHATSTTFGTWAKINKVEMNTKSGKYIA